jgi:hypothetical protein
VEELEEEDLLFQAAEDGENVRALVARARARSAGMSGDSRVAQVSAATSGKDARFSRRGTRPARFGASTG